MWLTRRQKQKLSWRTCDLDDRQLISHIGIAVDDLEAAIASYELLLGCKPILVTEVKDQKVKIAMFSPSATDSSTGGRIELLAGTDQDSPISRFIDKRGQGLHHTCIYVDDIEATLARLLAAGIRLIDQTPRIGVEGNKIAFVHPKGTNGVLIELEERPG